MGPDGPADAPAAGALQEDPAPARTAPYSWTELWPLVAAYPWDADVALLIILGPTPTCPNGESTGYAWAQSRDGARGLTQQGAGHLYRYERRGWSWDDAFDPERNLAIAFEIYETEGWRPWSCWS